MVSRTDGRTDGRGPGPPLSSMDGEWVAVGGGYAADSAPLGCGWAVSISGVLRGAHVQGREVRGGGTGSRGPRAAPRHPTVPRSLAFALASGLTLGSCLAPSRHLGLPACPRPSAAGVLGCGLHPHSRPPACISLGHALARAQGSGGYRAWPVDSSVCCSWNHLLGASWGPAF